MTRKEKSLGERLKRAREVRKVTLGDVARETGLSFGALYYIESGVSDPRHSTVEIIERWIGKTG